MPKVFNVIKSPLSLAVATTLVLGGCAAMFSGTKASLTVDSGDYSDAKIYLSQTGNPSAASFVGVGSGSFVLPKSQLNKATIVVKKPGCADGIAVIAGRLNPLTILNIFGSLAIGLAVDFATGAINKPVQDHYTVNPMCLIPGQPLPFAPHAGSHQATHPAHVAPAPTIDANFSVASGNKDAHVENGKKHQKDKKDKNQADKTQADQ